MFDAYRVSNPRLRNLAVSKPRLDFLLDVQVKAVQLDEFRHRQRSQDFTQHRIEAENLVCRLQKRINGILITKAWKLGLQSRNCQVSEGPIPYTR